MVTYGELLDIYFKNGGPSERPWSTQYRGAIFVGNDDERASAEAVLVSTQNRLGRKLYVAIEPAREFWSAEAYHQKYFLRGDQAVMREFAAMFPDDEAFVDSTAAARANGYLGGFGEGCADLDRLGLSAEGREKLARHAGHRRGLACGV